MASKIKHALNDTQLDLFTASYAPVVPTSVSHADLMADFTFELEFGDRGRFAKMYNELERELRFYRRREKDLDALLSAHDID